MRASTAAAFLTAMTAAAAAVAARPKAHGPSTDPYMPIEVCADKLAPPVDALLKPVLLGLAKERRAMRLHDPAYARQVQALLRLEHPRALEAQVAALAYYLGDQEGERVLELVLAQGKAADELVAKYRICRPPPRSRTSWATSRPRRSSTRCSMKSGATRTGPPAARGA